MFHNSTGRKECKVNMGKNDINNKKNNNKKNKMAQNYKTITAVLAIVSFYTTFEGLKSFVFQDEYTWQAVFISIAVQCLLYMISMRGIRLKDFKKSKYIYSFSKLFLYIILLGISSFFSFVFMSNTIYDGILEKNMVNTIESNYYEYNIEYSQYIEKTLPSVKENLINDVSQLITYMSLNVKKKEIDYSEIESTDYTEIFIEYGINIENIKNGTNTTSIEDIINNLNKGVAFLESENSNINDSIRTKRRNGNTDGIEELENTIIDNNEKISKIHTIILFFNNIKLENNQVHKYLLDILSEIENENYNSADIQNNMNKLRDSIYSSLIYDENNKDNFVQCMNMYGQIHTVLEKYTALYECKTNLSSFNDNFDSNQLKDKDAWIKKLEELKNIIGSTPYFEEDELFYDSVKTVNEINDITYNYSSGVNDAQRAITLLNGRNNNMAIFALIMALSLDLNALLVGNIQRKIREDDKSSKE